MFDLEQSQQLKQALPDFNLDAPLNSAALPSPLMHNYLEFYGFFETLKAFDLDYYWGVRSCQCGPEPRRVATHLWRLLNAKGTVLLVHGLFDHVGIFQKLISYFLGQGYSVIAVDLPGHGLSSGGATQINSFADYADALVDTLGFFAELIGTKPLYGVGQSTGAAVLMSACFQAKRASLSLGFERLVFLGPLVRPRKWSLSHLAYRLFGRFIQSIQRDFSVPNSHDGEFHNFLRYYDCLQPRRLCISWIGALHKWVQEFPSQPLVDTPLLIVQGTADTVVDWRFNVAVIQEHFPNSQLNYIEGAKHHLANEAEPWRTAVYSGIGHFLRQRNSAVIP